MELVLLRDIMDTDAPFVAYDRIVPDEVTRNV
jgi:hypothetical protein